MLLPVPLYVSHHVAHLHHPLPQCQFLALQDSQAAWVLLEHLDAVEHPDLWDQWDLWARWDLLEPPDYLALLLLPDSVPRSAFTGQPPSTQVVECLRYHLSRLVHALFSVNRLGVAPLLLLFLLCPLQPPL